MFLSFYTHDKMCWQHLLPWPPQELQQRQHQEQQTTDACVVAPDADHHQGMTH